MKNPAFGPYEGELRYVFFANEGRYDETVAFYQDILGLTITGGFGSASETMQGAYVRAGCGLIEIIADRGGEMKGSVLPRGEDYAAARSGYVLVEVEDVDETFKRASSRGAVIRQPLHTWPWGHRDFKVQDPWGNLLSLFSRIAKR